MNPLETAIAAIDAANAADPNRDGDAPRELLYGQRMTAEQQHLFPDASEPLQIACRGQHIERWKLPRSDYPMDKPGYLQWRQEQGRRHAERVAGIMRDAGYDAAAQDRVRAMLTKQGIKRDAEVQALEDVACFTFMRWYLGDFATTQDPDKMLKIVQKTARKMSSEARAQALEEFPMPYDFTAAFRDE